MSVVDRPRDSDITLELPVPDQIPPPELQIKHGATQGYTVASE